MFAVEMRNISKYFGPLRANDRVNFHVQSGEIHALVGENGAGKTTLMNVLYGLYQPDDGGIFIRGKREIINSPAKAISLGIGMVHQHFMLVPPFSVTENVILGMEPAAKFGRLNLPQSESAVKHLAETYGISIDPAARVDSLSVGMQQRVEILKVLYRNAQILVLDEPTPVLTPQEIEEIGRAHV